jgi:quinol monooxygenase YgiN
MMLVEKWNIHPDKVEAYSKWAPSAIKRTLAVPGPVEFRAYRTFSGVHQIVVTYEFADFAALAVWYSKEENQKVKEELYTLATDVSIEFWGPSPFAPKPIRP